MSRFEEKYGPWALVTGVSSNIGEQSTRQLPDRGLNPVRVAVDGLVYGMVVPRVR